MRNYSNSVCNLLTATLLVILSSVAIIFNLLYYQYPGNNYFPPHTTYVGLSLLLMYGGCVVQLGRTHALTLILKETVYFFLVMAVIALTTTAAQFTPFPTIDKTIVHYEGLVGIRMEGIISWTAKHPAFNQLLAFIYDTLPSQMSFIPLMIIIAHKFNRIREYYFLLFFSALIGFTFYYFFPTTAPASNIHSPLFGEAQRATGLKFNQLHQHIPPSTTDGGMVALPSFHAIWAWYCVYILRDLPFAVAILLPINGLLILSCVLLGWHYPIDIVASFFIVVLSHYAYRLCQRT